MISARRSNAILLSCGIGIGLAGDYLLRTPGTIGINIVLLLGALAGAIGVVVRVREEPLSLEARLLVGAALLTLLGVAWRGSETVQALCLLGAAATFSLPALHSGRAWLARSGVADLVVALRDAALRAGVGPILLAAREWERETEMPDAGQGTSGAARVRGVAVGVVVAIPLLVLFGALFASGDAVFAGLVDDMFRVDLAPIAGHLLLIGALAWLSVGFLSGFTRDPGFTIPRATNLRRMGPTEVVTVLVLLDLLFGAFVLIQLRYLFGGAALVEVTPGLTWAEYAREGFAQLVVAVGLAVPVLLVADWMLEDRSAGERRRARLLSAVQLGLLLLILISAAQRMELYQEAFGLTEDRYYVTAFLIWLVTLLFWFGATILRDRRDLFARGALVACFGLVWGIAISNPDARIARTNLQRAAEGAALDAGYLSRLSADAVPVILSGMDGLAPEARCVIASSLLLRFGPGSPPPDRRAWNLSVSSTRRLLAEEEAWIRQAMMSATGGCR